MKVVFLNRFFYPDISATSQMLSDLAFHLAETHDVCVITSRLDYERADVRAPVRELVNGAAVHRVWSSGFGRASLAGRAVDYATFYVAATLRLLSVLKRGDVVIAMTDPPLISVPASFIAGAKRAHAVNWVHDVFPEVAGELGFRFLTGLAGRPVAWLRDRSLARATCNVVLGELMAARLARRAVASDRIRVCHNWSAGDQIKPLPPEANPLRREWRLEGKFVVGYSGNMGRAHEFAALLDAAQLLSHRHEIVFLFIGGGNRRRECEAEAQSRRLSNVVFRPYQPRHMLAHSLTVPDCHIVSLKPSLEGLIVPSKLYSSMAAGRPVVFLGAPDGEIPTLMKSSPPFGHHVVPDDVPGLVQTIERLCDDRTYADTLGRNSRHVFEQRFDKNIAFTTWSALIGDLRQRDPIGARVALRRGAVPQ